MKEQQINIDEVAKKYGITLTHVDDGYINKIGRDKNLFANRSFAIGSKDIVLGNYNNNEHRLMSFFHELGHCIDCDDPYIPFDHKEIFDPAFDRQADTEYSQKYKSRYEMEASAWFIGFAEAAKNGIAFSADAYKWAQEQLNGYMGL